MPTIKEMIYSNFTHNRETKMVHSSFHYAKNNGSQFLADRLAEGLDITFNSEILNIKKTKKGWEVKGHEYDKVIFCGNIKNIATLLSDYIKLTGLS